MGADEFVFGVDLDGCVADFYGAMKTFAAEWTETPVEELTDDVKWGLNEWGIDDYDDFHRWAVDQRHLFRVVKPIPGAAQALRRLSKDGIRIRIITHRLPLNHLHQQSIAQTSEWLDSHHVPYRDICFMEEKAAVGASLYVDDGERFVTALHNDRLPVILFVNSTNRHVTLPIERADTWAEVERIVRRHAQEKRGAAGAVRG